MTSAPDRGVIKPAAADTIHAMVLLLDALDQALADPQCAPRWHRLLALWLESTDATVRREVVQILETSSQAEPRADILRLTFLAGATRESRFEHAAAQRVLAMEPADPDRLAAFIAYTWLAALQYCPGRTEFAAELLAARIPQMVGRLAQQAQRLLPRSFAPRISERIDRLAAVVPYVGNQFHTPSVMAAVQCTLLAREGLQVRIFSAQELTPPENALFRGDAGVPSLPALDLEGWVRALPAGLSMTVSDARFSLSGRWRNMMPVLADFDPDAVLMVGFYSPLAAALYRVRPVVGISVNTVPPIAPVDVWLTADPAAPAAQAWGEVFPPSHAIYHPQRLRRESKRWGVTRAQLGMSETDVIWVTAGFRLEHEISGEWAARMLDLLSRHHGVCWLLVGGEGKMPPALRQAAPGRVRVLPTREDISGILRLCDIFVNPPRMGGGFSVAEAMAEAMPVTAFAGSDGGDKVGPLAIEGIDAYVERLAALTRAPDLRAAMGETLRRRFAEHFDSASSGPALLAAFKEAAARARVRLSSAAS